MRERFLDCVRDEIALGLERGAPLAEVQAELIDAAGGLSEDERAALWLFAWSYRPGASNAAKRLIGSAAR